MASIAPDAATTVGHPPTAPAAKDFNVAAHGLRGVAAMMVFFAHLLGGTAEHIYAADAAYEAAVRPFWNIGTFGVQLFFVISGFVIVPSVTRYALGEFALRRLLRLYPLFLAFSLFFVALNFATDAYPKLNTPLAVVSGLFFVNLFTGTEQLTPNAWSLSFEVMFYIAAALIWYFAAVRRNLVLTAIMVLLAAAFWLRFPMASYFIFGVLVRIAHDRRWFLPTRLAHGAEVLMFAAMLWLASFDHYEYHLADLAKPVVVPLMLCTASYFMLAVHPRSWTAAIVGNRATLYLGTVSYSLYIVHPYVYLPLRMLFAKMGWFTDDAFASLLVFAAVSTPLMLAATAFVHDHFERRPYAWFFRQDVYRRQGAADRKAG